MPGEAPSEVLGESEDVADRGAGIALRQQVARQLANLDPLQLELARRIPTGNAGAQDGRQKRFLLGAGPSHEPSMKVVERQAASLDVASIERLFEIVE